MDKLFSFDYGGRPFPEGFERSPQGAEVWAHPSGLTVTVESTSDPGTGAQEWTLWFENRGTADSAPLTNVYPLDARAAFPDECTVTTAKGTSAKIDDFVLVTDSLRPGESKEYAACGSRAYIPFFNVGGEQAGYLPLRVLGVRPLEPGYRTFVVDPVPSDLEWARGSVITPHGPIHASWRRRASGALEIECIAPAECRRVEQTEIGKGRRQ